MIIATTFGSERGFCHRRGGLHYDHRPRHRAEHGVWIVYQRDKGEKHACDSLISSANAEMSTDMHDHGRIQVSRLTVIE